MNIRTKSDFIIVAISVLVFSTTRVIYSLLIINWNNYEKGNVTPSFLFWIDFISYFVVFFLYLLYGWYIRRKLVKKNQDKGDYSLHYIIRIFITIYAPIFLISFVISFIKQIDLRIYYTASIFNETVQMMFFSTLVGILLYNQIEQFFSKVFKSSNYQKYSSEELTFLEQSIVKTINRFWSYALYTVLFFVFLANFLVLVIYPSIPTEYDSSIKLIIAYPNFSFTFNKETGFHQEFFTYLALDYTKFLNWKLIQSLLCILFILAIALLYYLPLHKKENEPLNNVEKQEIAEIKSKTEEVQSTEKGILKQKDTTKLNNTGLQQEIDSIVFLNTENDYYTPIGFIKKRNRKLEKLLSQMKKSDIIPVMNLAALNLGLAMVFVYFVHLFVPLAYSSYTLSDILYIQLSSLYWAGLFEEISFRFLIMGVPLFIIHGFRYLIAKILQYYKSKNEVPVKEKEENKKIENPFLYLTGRWKKLRIIDFVFLIASSFFFGYVHYQFGSWAIWKIFQAGIAGLIFGYAFYKFGLHAAIFLHTVNDFAIGIMLVPNLGLMVQGGFVVIVLVLMGIMYSFYIFSLFLKKTSNLSFRKLNKQKEVN
ncbi:MAG: CPBP family intramembrane metalloprotease [Candidatus Heimdallarchaeum aukensis]|uniref:CPBP family intramembrane metalloprotease n=1 Tax=Candidatus Heimdallarchaeum aukensis TaxID=2876573 RepID=A0A9Y1FLI7_9ARCH|nr:MAG: CPBP family intramembrane metalloprotease [Candidatus Heimdallarchaeum aukensis]